ncbi:EboA domain-containing protein [Maribacter algicola]|uniref:EboA domain-containing protein n=1 Tax=Meishania litoralis TaxID=3434685 RepID=A0ACC7LKY2_9FLAO
MQVENVGAYLSQIVEDHVSTALKNWLGGKIKNIVDERSAKDLYLTYSLIGTKFGSEENLEFATDSDVGQYLKTQRANIRQVARIYLLVKVLEADTDFFAPKVANIIQVADTGELETFLKFLILLPDPVRYKTTAVDALRTNIATVFNAIAYNNPYPSLFFNDQQWNQMYLKTAFMQGDLSAIMDIDKMANTDLVRIISDYAHERWAAGRAIDPYFWRPVSKFLNDTLLGDMKRLLASDDPMENKAGALCCYGSDYPEAKKELENHEDLVGQIENKTLTWENLKE